MESVREKAPQTDACVAMHTMDVLPSGGVEETGRESGQPCDYLHRGFPSGIASVSSRPFGAMAMPCLISLPLCLCASVPLCLPREKCKKCKEKEIDLPTLI